MLERWRVTGALVLFLNAAPAQACISDWRMMFFAHGSAELDHRARAILDNGVAAFFATGDATSRIRLSASAARSGSDAFNMRLSLHRAETVRGYLTSAGIPASRIDLVPFGESRPLIETPDGKAEPQNRYVMLEEVIAGEEGQRREAQREAAGDGSIC